MNKTEALHQIASFSLNYDYDMTYQRELLHASPGAFQAFGQAMPLSLYRQALSLEAHFVAAHRPS